MTFLMVLSPTFKDLIVKTGNFDFEPSAKTIVPWPIMSESLIVPVRTSVL
jgi:hypothetical protein